MEKNFDCGVCGGGKNGQDYHDVDCPTINDPPVTTERRGRPTKNHTDGETRPCAICRAAMEPARVEHTTEEFSDTRKLAESLIDDFIRIHVR